MHHFIDHKAVATPHSVSASRKPKLHKLVSICTTELECVFERQKDMKMVVATRH